MRSTLQWCSQNKGWKADWNVPMTPPTMPWMELCGASTDGLREVWEGGGGGATGRGRGVTGGGGKGGAMGSYARSWGGG